MRSISYLLDTQVILWMDREASRIPLHLSTRLNEATHIYCSAASCWETAIKRATGKLGSQTPLSELAFRFGLAELAVTVRHGEAAGALPLYHKDPFDRVLIAQAQIEGLTLVTADAALQLYDVSVLLI